MTYPAIIAPKLGVSERGSAHSFTPAVLEGQSDQPINAANTVFSQSALEATTYAALAGSHVGFLPVHVAARWVAQGRLVAVGRERFSVQSSFFLVRLRQRQHSSAADALWSMFCRGRTREPASASA